MYHPDLSPVDSRIADRFRYRSWKNYDSGLPVLYVGWLQESFPFPQGQASAEFIEKLRLVCQHPIALYKGYHVCGYCGAMPRMEVYLPKRYLERPNEEAVTKDALVGSYDVEVIGTQAVYCIPGLILHYVEHHNYLPPQEFIDAVLGVEVGYVPTDPDGEAGRIGIKPDDPDIEPWHARWRWYWYWPVDRTPNAQGLSEFVIVFRQEQHAHKLQSELSKLGRCSAVGEMNLEEWIQGKVNRDIGKLRKTGPGCAFPPLKSAFYLHTFAQKDELWNSMEPLDDFIEQCVSTDWPNRPGPIF